MKFFKQHLALLDLPTPSDAAQGKAYAAPWEELKASDAASALPMLETLPTLPEGRALLQCIFGSSPYLSSLILRHPRVLQDILDHGFDRAFQKTMADSSALPPAHPKEDIMAALRRAKQECALITALADIYGYWPLEKVTRHLSEFAELALQKSVGHLLYKAGQAGTIKLADSVDTSRDSGLIVLGVGKLGSYELNYSSDIDLIFFYDEEKVQFTGRTTISQFFVRLAQDVSYMMQERTKDGYVFRVDLRLRPDPGSTPSAMSVKAAEYYYETVGQNWERAAMIKARPVAGDLQAGEKLQQFLGRYIWRKYLDFASIQDIHSIKRQIRSKVGQLPVGLLDYNVKLGHGGIREIEFYAQTQQLIWGGRESALRLSATLDALAILFRLGKISEEAYEEMTAAYRFYRTVEHRLQMVADQQTHSLPGNEDEMERFALFMGFKGRKAFLEQMQTHLTHVQGHYSKLFESSPSLASQEVEGSLVFTGVEDDPETIETLKRMGYENPSSISEAVRGWHHGRARATRTKRARELLTELMPLLLNAFAKTASPDVAFLHFNEFLTRLPAGVQIFSLFHAQPHLLDFLAEIMGGYPYVAENLSRKPALIEYMLSQEFFAGIPDAEKLTESLKRILKQARDYQDVLDLTRAWTHDQQFRVGVQLIRHQITASDASAHLSSIAEAVIPLLLHYVMEDFARHHGKVSPDAFAIIAMGKLGGREITFASDLDLVFIYDPKAYPEKGELSASEYFIRLSRRYIAAVTSLTPEGMLYSVDTRLRPSGNDGPVACSTEAFNNYYGSAREENAAWEWEYMALTRARILAGGPFLSAAIEAIIEKKLETRWKRDSLAPKVIEMRARIDQGYRTDNPFKIKYVAGGLIDIEFISQFLQLIHAAKHPEALSQNTRQALHNMTEAGILTQADGKALTEAYALFHSLQSTLRLMGNKQPQEDSMSPVTRAILAEATATQDFEDLKKRLVASQKKVQNLFGKLIA